MDTREIQKEINLLSGKLDRTFIVADELIFRVSSVEFQDVNARCSKTQKHSTALRSGCFKL